MTLGSCGSDLGLPLAFALGFAASAFAAAFRFGAAFALGACFGRAACFALLSFGLPFLFSAEHALGITDAGFSAPSFLVCLFLDMGLLLCPKGVQTAATGPLQFAASLAIGLAFLSMFVFFPFVFSAFALGGSFAT